MESDLAMADSNLDLRSNFGDDECSISGSVDMTRNRIVTPDEFSAEELAELAAKETAARRHMKRQTPRESRESDSQHNYSRSIEVATNNPAINDARYRAEFKTSGCKMTEDEFVSLRRSEDGLEEFIPSAPPKPATAAKDNPLASGLFDE